jgi:hypothetical protein
MRERDFAICPECKKRRIVWQFKEGMCSFCWITYYNLETQIRHINRDELPYPDKEEGEE